MKQARPSVLANGMSSNKAEIQLNFNWTIAM
jgi:hypothetical protein